LLRSTDRASRESGILPGEANRNLLTRTQDLLYALKLIKIHDEEACHIRRFNDAVTDVNRRFIDFQKC